MYVRTYVRTYHRYIPGGQPAPRLNERENREARVEAGPGSADWMAMEHESASHIRRNPRSDLSASVRHFHRAGFYERALLQLARVIPRLPPFFFPPLLSHRSVRILAERGIDTRSNRRRNREARFGLD